MDEGDQDVREMGVETRDNLQICFVGLIVQNDATQDCVETASILKVPIY